ncbi:hypothetical protein KSS87_001018 [Heliosperma pusillum]|nr:hypothetical protein KSS87_001018 [Heliosperma pusillum]
MAKTLGSVGFFSTYRPPQPLELFSLPTKPSSTDHEIPLTDGKSYNYNGQAIPPAALKLMLNRPMLAPIGTAADVDSGQLLGLIFVSERTHGLETLHICLTLGNNKPVIFSFAEVYGTYNEARMEDSPVFAGEYLVYVTTKDPAPARIADLNPAVSPDGSKIAVSTFQGKEGGWQGEIENLKTNIYVFSIDDPSERTMIIENGGWPSWGSNNVIFFHHKFDDTPGGNWGVFRADLSDPSSITTSQVTPNDIKAITPVAIDENTVIVGTIRASSTSIDQRQDAENYRHIEIFDSTGQNEPVPVTKNIKPKADHYNPFIILQTDSSIRIGFHRGVIKKHVAQTESQELMNIQSPVQNLGVFRVSGVFPTFSKDGTKLAFVDNEFTTVFVTDTIGPVRTVYEGPSFDAAHQVDIMAIFDASTPNPSDPYPVVSDTYNNAFPSSNPDGTRLVFRSTNGGGEKLNKNLYIREDAHLGKEAQDITITRLTTGDWTDTHCDWSPNGKWIVFSSTRDKPADAPLTDNNLDPGCFAVYLLALDSPDVVIRVIYSGSNLYGHVNHPFFSPNGSSIVVASDLAAVSCDAVSLPLFTHSVRPYGDIFTVDIDPDNIQNNKDIPTFHRMTHSKFENSTCTWTVYSTNLGFWNLTLNKPHILRCPYAHPDGSEGWQMTGHLIIPNRRC